MIINCIATDDEHPALLKIENYIAKVPFLHLVAKFDNAFDTLEFLKQNQVDLLFLDIEMEEFNGMQLLKILKNRPKVILTTAYDNYAIKAFEFDVADYLLKPISFERFLISVEKIYDAILEKQFSVIENSKKNKLKRDYIFIKTEFRMQRVDYKDILYIEGMKEYLQIVTINDKILTLQNFKNIEEALPNDNFVRVHRSFIIAIDKIESVERNRIKIAEKKIPIGETYKNGFHRILKDRGL
jgi:DNA-binding LytR/AlgR family response regulator